LNEAKGSQREAQLSFLLLLFQDLQHRF
jgi:hypothetical protein